MENKQSNFDNLKNRFFSASDKKALIAVVCYGCGCIYWDEDNKSIKKENRFCKDCRKEIIDK